MPIETKTTDKFADRWRFLPLKDAMDGPNSGFCQIIRNSWWVVCPERGLVFFWSRGERGLGSPQCNINEVICKRLGTTLPGATIEYVDKAIVPICMADFQ